MVNYRLCETLGSNSGVLEDSGLWDVMPCGRVGVFRRASICKWWGVQEEHESTTFLRNVGKHQPIDVVSHRRRPESYNRDYSYCGCNRDAIRPCFMGCKEHISSVHACYISDLSHPSWFNRLNEIFRSKEDGHDTTRNARATICQYSQSYMAVKQSVTLVLGGRSRAICRTCGYGVHQQYTAWRSNDETP